MEENDDNDSTTKNPIIPRPGELRETPLSEFMKKAIELLNAEYKGESKCYVDIPVPENCQHEPDIILRVAQTMASQGWDIMILGSFELPYTGPYHAHSIAKIINCCDSAQFLIASPSSIDSVGKIIPNADGWKIVDGELKYNSKHAVWSQLKSSQCILI